MKKLYRKLWILLREKLTRCENDREKSIDRDTYHAILTEMPEMEAAEFWRIEHMKVKASELRPGQVISAEYGDYDNWVNFIVDRVEPREQRVVVYYSKGLLHMNFSYSPDEQAEVVE